MVAVAPMRDWPASSAVATVPWTRNERSATAGLKTTSYAENVVALAHARANGAGEALLANTVGNLCEGTGSNVFLVLDGQVVTPPLSSGCLAGVTRALLLEWADVIEREIADDELTGPRRSSSPRRPATCRRARGRRRTLDGAPGPVTRKVAAVFAERSAADVDP